MRPTPVELPGEANVSARIPAARRGVLTPLDVAMLGSLALSVTLNVVAARLAWGWTTAAATDVLIGLYLLALAWRRDWRPLLARLFVFGLIVGIMELFTDAAGEQFAHSLIYPAGQPMLWASPLYMPLSWALVLTQIGYLAWRLRAVLSVRVSVLLCALWAGANIPFYEEMAFHAGWWRYVPVWRIGHTPLYVILFEALIGASLPLLLGGLQRRSWRAVAARAVVAGAWVPCAALIAWLAIGR